MCLLVFGQKGRKRALQRVRMAANRVRRVAIVRALAVEAQIRRRRHKERFQQVIVGHRIDFGGDVQDASADGHRTPKAEQTDT